ncbi:MAG: helix-turn-helix transcriptional regulator, partial [Paracoccaceae bacterium]
AERSWGSGATLRAFAPGKVNDPQFSAWWARLERQTCSPSAAAQLARLEAHVNVQPLLAQIQAPTLILHRLSDARVNAAAGRYLAQHIKGARFVALSGKDNPIWAGDGDAVADEVEGFLTGTPPHSDGRRVLAALLTVRTCGPGAGRMRLADANWRDAVERLGAAAEGIARSHGGVSLRPPGEPILMRFDAPARAATAAVLLREVARGMKLVVAQGLHVGEVEPGAEAATSTALWVTEAIAQAAQSDDILASGTAADLSAGSGQRFAEHAALTIPGEERPTRIFSLIVEQHLEPAHAKPAPLEPDLAVLSQREREVLDLVAIGLSTSGIALRLRLSDHTVKRHVSNILTKLDLPNRASATALLARQQS